VERKREREASFRWITPEGELVRSDSSSAARSSDDGDAKVMVEVVRRRTRRRNGVAMKGSVAIAGSEKSVDGLGFRENGD
jgi:hypothetical protein